MKTPKVNITAAYPYIKSLAHKDVFGNMMELGQLMAPDHFKFCPATFNFPNERELARFFAYQERNPKTIYIAKPKSGKKGNNIHLF
jgi:hypothetical protein